MKLHLTRSDAEFRSRLEFGWPWQQFVQKWLLNHGFYVECEHFHCRPDEHGDKARRGELKSEPDLWLPKNKLGVEVKAKDVLFTSIADFPFPTAWICNLPSFQRTERSKQRRLAMVLVSVTTGAMVVVPWRPTDWGEEPAKDGSYGYPVMAAAKHFLRPMSWFLQFAEKADG